MDLAADIKATLQDMEIAWWLSCGNRDAQARQHDTHRSWIAEQSCDFIMEDPEFTKWYDEPTSRQLIILGDTGSGKSILTSFLIQTLMNRASNSRHRLPTSLMCFHYCPYNEEREKVIEDELQQVLFVSGTRDIISSLLLSLIHQRADTKRAFYDWVKRHQANGCSAPASDVAKLRAFFSEAISSVEQPLRIVLDGLDQCDERSRGEILGLFGAACERNENLKVLYTSRPYEDVIQDVGRMPCIKLVADASIDRKIAEFTVEKEMPRLDSQLKMLVIEYLARSAHGSKLWIRMATGPIKLARLKTSSSTQTFLRNMPLPVGLNNLYNKMLRQKTSYQQLKMTNRGGDICRLRSWHSDLAPAIAALQILVASKRALETRELAWATAMAMAPRYTTTVAALADHVNGRRIVELIEPFVHKRTSQFTGQCVISPIHPSVKNFVLEVMRREDVGIVGDYARGIDHYNHKLQEYMLKDVCLRYLLLLEINRWPLFSSQQVLLEALPQADDVFENYGPQECDLTCSWEEWEKDMVRFDPAKRGFGNFFAYASKHWVGHLALVDKLAPILEHVEKACAAGTMRLHNWTAQNARPGCALQARYDFDGNLYDPLGIVSLYASEIGFRDFVCTSTFAEGTYLSNTGLAAVEQILRYGNIGRVKVLFEEKRLGLDGLPFWQMILKHWEEKRHSHSWDTIFRLLGTSNLLTNEAFVRGLLSQTVRANCLPMAIHVMMDLFPGNTTIAQVVEREYGERNPCIRVMEKTGVGRATRMQALMLFESDPSKFWHGLLKAADRLEVPYESV